FQQVIYLPGLEIRTRDNGEELHVITLPGGHGNVRCLHWKAGKPAHIPADQLRYSLDDHLGSCSLELDQQAQVISQEGYYPFGATAWFARGNEVEVDYKTIRYSGQEMDDSGLYYYGARYYAPWLQRWISADPAGDVDGLNLYAFVGNNPIAYADAEGEKRISKVVAGLRAADAAEIQRQQEANAPARAKRLLQKDIERHLKILGLSKRRGLDARQQILNHRSMSQHVLSATRRTAVHIGGQVLSYGAGIAVGVGAQALAVAAPGVGNAAGVVIGFAVKKGVSFAVDYLAERTGASASIKFKTSKLSPEKIISKAEYKTMNYLSFIQKKYEQMGLGSTKNQLKAAKEATSVSTSQALKVLAPQIASEASTAMGILLGGAELFHEMNSAGSKLSAEKIAKADIHLTNLIGELNERMTGLEASFNSLQVCALNTFSLFGETAGDSVQSLWEATRHVIGVLTETRTILRSRSSKFSAV
ncbi:RHS repeat-associated core domain-containing protein, partial [Pseudomonas sp. NPDC086278]|uniref:RHS repeat-associated core domain-containing protein n=1 Tax=Pseudomonas sp. NPDC086278 TaxID=3390646 RepID=UPI003CFFAD98